VKPRRMVEAPAWKACFSTASVNSPAIQNDTQPRNVKASCWGFRLRPYRARARTDDTEGADNCLGDIRLLQHNADADPPHGQHAINGVALRAPPWKRREFCVRARL
jgi:hypothetical protein